MITAICLLLSANAHPMGTNLSGVNFYTSNVMFVDAMRSSRPWHEWETNEPWPDVDERGYPVLKEGDVVHAVALNQFHPAGEVTLTWEGDAEVELVVRFGEAELKPLTDEPGRRTYLFEPGDYAVVRVSGGAVTDIRLWLPGFEDAESPFWPPWVAGLEPYSQLRLMDAMATNDSVVETWDQRSTEDHLTFMEMGVPLEWLIDLSNKTGKAPWFCVPHRADDTFVRKMAALVRDRLQPEIPVTVEYSNEVHNGAFAAHAYAAEQGLVRGYSTDTNEARNRFHAVRTAEISQIWKSILGPERVRVVFTDIFRREEHVPPIVEALKFLNAHEHIDAFGTAPYVGVGLGAHFDRSFTEVSMSELFEYLFDYQRTLIIEELRRARSVADRFGMDLVAYEGGQHVSKFGGRVRPEHEDGLAEMIAEANRDPRMEALYRRHFDDWFDAGGGDYMHFSHVARPSVWGSWGFQTYVGEPPETAPKLRALLGWLAENGARVN